MMSARLRTAIGLGVSAVLAAGLVSVATAQQGTSPPLDGGTGSGTYFTLVDRLRSEALQLERELNLDQALVRWEMIREMNSDDVEAEGHISVLRAQTRLLADQYFRTGVALLKKKRRDEARDAFLLAVTFDPEHEEALEYLRRKTKAPDWVYYTVVSGDSLEVIADKAYTDPKKDFLVAAFNNMSDTAVLQPGLVLKLPILEHDLRAPAVDVGQVLANAKKLVKEKKFDQAVSIAENILLYDPGNNAARDIINLSYHSMAKEMAAQDELLNALQMFRQVDASYRDVEESIAGLEKDIKGIAESHYKKGVSHFIKEDLDQAIESWQLALRFDPGHQKAQKDLQNARNLREKLEQVR